MTAFEIFRGIKLSQFCLLSDSFWMTVFAMDGLDHYGHSF